MKSIWNTRTIKILAGVIIYCYALGLLLSWANMNRGDTRNFNDRPLVYDKFPESDFLVYWAASSLALAGEAQEVYNPNYLFRAEDRVIHPHHKRAWIYPPTYLLVCLPLALVPFLPSLFIWGTATLAGYVAVLKRINPHPLTIWLTLAFPACFHTLVRGQNSFLSGILFGAGLFILDNHPLMAGLLLGLMVYKPHLAMLIPLALLAGRRWRAFGGFALAALGMIILSIALFGVEIWPSFFKTLLHETQGLEAPGFLFYHIVPTVFASAALLGLTPKLALWVHWPVALIAAGAALLTWYREAPLRIRASTLIIATLLPPPRVHL